jgi:hypothetical protein
VVAGFLAVVANLLVVRAVVGIPLRSQAKAAMQPIPAAACMGAVIIGVSHAMASLPAPATLSVSVMAGLLTYLVGLRLTAPQIARAGLTALRTARLRRGVPLDGHGAAQTLSTEHHPATAECKEILAGQGRSSVLTRLLRIARRYLFRRNSKDVLHK